MSTDIQITLADQTALVTYLQSLASLFYDADFRPPQSIIQKLNFTRLADKPLPFFWDSDASKRVGDWLMDKGITEYSEFASGNSAMAIAARAETGKYCIIRLPTDVDFPEEHRRLDHVAVTQPLKDAAEHPIIFPYLSGTRIEVLPFMCTASANDDQDDPYQKGKPINPQLVAGKPILNKMIEMMGIARTYRITKDLGGFPDGTPVPVDPDTFRAGRKLSLEEIICCQAEVLRAFPAMEPVLWIKDGKPKQEHFFPPGYLSTPLAPRAAVAVTVDPRSKPMPS